MKEILIIGSGGFIGSALRYLLGKAIHLKINTTFPIGTLSINVIGCLLIGLIFGYSEKNNLSIEWKFFLATGICGGFTTFSTFGYESISLLRSGNFLSFFTYISLSIVLGLGATISGILITKN